MIRDFKTGDLDRIMDIWLGGNLDAHPFISREYWYREFKKVREMIPRAEIFVYEDEDGIQGFLGILGYYMSGLFVDAEHRSLGIGKKLLDAAKEKHRELMLSVYADNKRAFSFYEREGFEIVELRPDENTGAAEYEMRFFRS